ncbi:MAG: NUDIX domain-containing protein [Pseudomonadota bacterium]
MTVPVRVWIASVIVLRQDQVLLMRRAGTLAGAWCQVAGKIEQGEAAWQTGLRELAEETRLVPQAYWSADYLETFYEPARDIVTVGPVFVARVAPDAEPRLNEEHDAYRWLSFGPARDLVSFGGQRQMLSWVEQEFVHRAPSPHLEIAL